MHRSATVTLGSRADLLREEAQRRDLTFVDGAPGDRMLHAQVRAHGEPVPASSTGTSCASQHAQPRVARGQVVALYDGDRLVGGGIAA